MSFCSSCGKAVELDWVTCPYCQHPLTLNVRKNETLIVRTDIEKEINNLVELAVFVLKQRNVSEFDRIFLSAKEKDVKLGIIKFQEDYRILEELLNIVKIDIIFLEEAHRKMNNLFEGDIHKIEIQNRGENALSTMMRGELYSDHDTALFHTLYSRLFNILSYFDLVWDKRSMKRLSKSHRVIARQMIADNPMIDNKKAKIAMNQSLRSKQKLDSTTSQMGVLAVLIWSFIFFIVAIFYWSQ